MQMALSVDTVDDAVAADAATADTAANTAADTAADTAVFGIKYILLYSSYTII